MSSRVVYTCDRCKRESTEKGFIRQVRSGVVHPNYVGYTPTGSVMFDGCILADWCDDCRREAHFFTNAELYEMKQKGLPIPEQPTLEMQISELVREMVGEMVADHIANGT